MTRERFLDPEVCKSEQVARLTDPWAKLLWDRIIVTSDDQGRRKASAYSLKADCFPLDDLSVHDIQGWLHDIADVGLIRLYMDDDGAMLLDIPRWSRYQKLKHPRQPRLPEFPGSGALRPTPPEPAGTGPDCPEPAQVAPNVPELPTGCGVEGRGAVGSGGEGASAAPSRAAAEADNEDPPTSVAEPVPTAPETATEPLKETDKKRLDWPEVRAWVRVFELETAVWNGTDQPVRTTAHQRIELGFTAAQLVLANVVEINRRPQNQPWGTLGNRLSLCRTPSDKALKTAGKMLREAAEAHAGPGPP